MLMRFFLSMRILVKMKNGLESVSFLGKLRLYKQEQVNGQKEKSLVWWSYRHQSFRQISLIAEQRVN